MIFRLQGMNQVKELRAFADIRYAAPKNIPKP